MEERRKEGDVRPFGFVAENEEEDEDEREEDEGVGKDDEDDDVGLTRRVASVAIEDDLLVSS